MKIVKALLQDANEYLGKAEYQYKVGDNDEAETNAQMAIATLLLDVSLQLRETNAYLKAISKKLGLEV